VVACTETKTTTLCCYPSVIVLADMLQSCTNNKS